MVTAPNSDLDLSRRGFARIAALAGVAAAGARAGTPEPQVVIPVKSYAQELVDRICAQHPDLRSVLMYAPPVKGDAAVVIAST